MVSVLMPAFKAGYLENAIQSVLNQTVRNFELIIVNDKSPEDIDSVVDSFNDARIRYYKNKENIGKDDPVKNWNHCLSYATGEYVCLLCDDDEYSPLFLEKMLGLAKKYPSANVFRARAKVVNNNGEIVHYYNTISEHLKTEDAIHHFLTGCLETTISEWMLKRSRMEECDGYFNAPLAWFSDELSMFRFSLKGGICYCDDCLVSFRASENNISNNGYRHAQRWLDATNVFEDEMNKIIGGFEVEWSNLLTGLLDSYISLQKQRYISFLSLTQFIKVVSHKRRYRLSRKDIAMAVYLFPRNYALRLKRFK